MAIQNNEAAAKGPVGWFTGDAWINGIVGPTEDSTISVAEVPFVPGARSAWHSHECGQARYVVDGVGRDQSRGEEVVEIRSGDVYLTRSGEEHGYGASHDHLMTHISITRGPATWGEHVNV